MPNHVTRRWSVRPVTEDLRRYLPDAPEQITLAELLARFLVECAATPCTAFAFGKYLFLNDSDSQDEGQEQEYAIIDNTTLEQIDSVVFNWMTVAGAFEFILNLIDGNFDHLPILGKIESRQLRTPTRAHEQCKACKGSLA